MKPKNPKREVVIARRGSWKGRAMPLQTRMQFLAKGAIAKTRDGTLAASAGNICPYNEVHLPTYPGERARTFLK